MESMETIAHRSGAENGEQFVPHQSTIHSARELLLAESSRRREDRFGSCVGDRTLASREVLQAIKTLSACRQDRSSTLDSALDR